MVSGSWARYAPLSGVLAVALAVVSIIVTGFDDVAADDSVVTVVEFWRDNDSQQIAGAIISALALVPLLWFLGSLRSALRAAEGETGRLSAIAFAGGIVLVAGGAVDASMQFAVADTADELPPVATQTLSALYSDFFLIFPVGLATFLLASALAILRTGALPSWVGWVALVLGVVALTPISFFVFFLILVWIAIVSVMLFQRQPRPPVQPTLSPPA
jgi:hypothetical protein